MTEDIKEPARFGCHVGLWRQHLSAEALRNESDEVWRARVLAEAKANRCPPLDPFSDPTMTLRVREAKAGDHVARRLLLRLAREALGVKQVNDLPLSVRLYLKEISAANAGKLPAAAGGRPPTAWKFALAVAVEIEMARGLASGAAIIAVAKCASSRETIRKAHTRWRKSREMRAEIARRRYEAKVGGLGQSPKVDLGALARLDPKKGKAPRRKLPKVR